MNLIGKFLTKLQAFPEYKKLINDVDELQNQDGNILNGLQKFFGPSLNDYARNQEPVLKQKLMSINDTSKLEIEAMRELFTATSSFPKDIKQLNAFHDDIIQKRKTLSDLQKRFDKYDKDVSSSLQALEKAKNASMNSDIKSRLQSTYDDNCKKKQEVFEALESQKQMNENIETEYRKQFLQTIVAGFESYMKAYARMLEDIIQIGENLIHKVDELDSDLSNNDQSIADLEARLQLLETEPLDN